MPIKQEPLTLANFGGGKLAEAVDKGIADIVERIRQAEAGECKVSKKKGFITLKLSIEASSEVNGFVCAFDDPSIKLPPIVRYGTHAVQRDGVLVVSIAVEPQQVRLLQP